MDEGPVAWLSLFVCLCVLFGYVCLFDCLCLIVCLPFCLFVCLLACLCVSFVIFFGTCFDCLFFSFTFFLHTYLLYFCLFVCLIVCRCYTIVVVSVVAFLTVVISRCARCLCVWMCVRVCVCLMCFWSSLRVCLWLCVIVFACLRSLRWLVVPVGRAANQYCGSAESMPEAQESREEIQQQLGCQQTRTSGALEQVRVCMYHIVYTCQHAKVFNTTTMDNLSNTVLKTCIHTTT